jgi:hypothetical protein
MNTRNRNVKRKMTSEKGTADFIDNGRNPAWRLGERHISRGGSWMTGRLCKVIRLLYIINRRAIYSRGNSRHGQYHRQRKESDAQRRDRTDAGAYQT